MSSLWNRHGRRVLITSGIVVFSSPCFVMADAEKISQIGGVIIPQTFRVALQDGMSLPLFIHLEGNSGTQDDQRIGSAFIWLDNGKVRLRQICLEDKEQNATVSDQIRQTLTQMADEPFNKSLSIPLSADAKLQFDLRRLLLQLVVKKGALGTVLRSRSEDIGQSSVDGLSSSLTYNLGVYNNQMSSGGDSTSSYLSLNNVIALREHHLVLDGSIYGAGTSNQNQQLYKAMYERDFAGHRFAGGMLDTWNLQSLGPMTAISAGKIYGASWGNQASSTVFDNSQSVTPIVAFLSAAGEVHLKRDGRLLSVQNFAMGNHEVDTRGLPYGIYDIEVEVIINGRSVSKRTQRVNKLFSRGRGAGAPLAWQVWGGSFHMDRWSQSGRKTQEAKDTWLAGVSSSGAISTLSWSATGYGYDTSAVAEARFTLPLTNAINVNLQNMAASDGSWSTISSVSATLPGGFSSVWVNQEKTSIGDTQRRSDADNRAIGGSLNLGSLWSKLGTFSISYNDDRENNSHYYTADYYQTIYSGSFGSLGLRAGIQRFNNSGSSSNSGSDTGKYIALDLSLPLGNWLSAGMSHQNGYSTANLSARKRFKEGPIRTIGANMSRAVSGNTGDDKTLSGGAYAQFETRYANGTLNVNSGADGYVNTNLSASGSVGWQGKHIAASGRTDGNSGVIFHTGLEDDGQLSAKVNGRIVQLSGNRNYLPLSPYNRYEVELQNSKNSLDSYDIVSGRKSRLTLYPGNVAVLEPEVKQMVTVSGRIRAEDGSLLANAHISNHIGRTRTDDNGEFVMDVDKKFPVIDFNYGKGQSCEVALDLNQARGAVWVGDVVCSGLQSYAGVQEKEDGHES
ncbi:fimbrial biogenesis outer membrane usher protein [Klebsiella aerogenes]|uniref:fimbrial biogenesis outer membrane usher protein n=1 Tax=Klebsiella aerogenes TaxID=548 RepID=UPI001BCAA64B|nr:fimbrial biogenesis outer membrane usher protein [Klebsiella aerogenes]